MSSRNEKRLITGKNLKMTSDFTPLPQLDEGEYVGRLVRKFQSPPRWGRQDLVMDFEVQANDFEPVLVNAYFQVKWIDSKTFSAGRKSDYFRAFQTCFGRVSSTEFSLDDFPEGSYTLDITNVTKDGNRQPLDPINQYSTVKRIKGRIDHE